MNNIYFLTVFDVILNAHPAYIDCDEQSVTHTHSHIHNAKVSSHKNEVLTFTETELKLEVITQQNTSR